MFVFLINFLIQKHRLWVLVRTASAVLRKYEKYQNFIWTLSVFGGEYLFVHHLSFPWCVGRIVLLDCVISLKSLLKCLLSLRKHAYANILKSFPPKNENFQIKMFNIFHISARNTDCGYSLELPRRGGSNEYPQSMFLSRNKKNNVYPCKPQFYYIKVGFKGVKTI